MSNQRADIELTGIVRNIPGSIVSDGTMQELLNIRPKDKAWRVVGKKEKALSTPTNVKYIHRIDENIYIVVGYDNTDIRYWVYTAAGLVKSNQLLVNSVGKTFKFSSTGAVLVISPDDDHVSYAVFNTITNLYTYYEEAFPDTPDIAFMEVDKPISYKQIITDWDVESIEAGARSLMAEKKNYVFGYVMFRAAWELFDGTIVRQSLPFLVLLSRFGINKNVSSALVQYQTYTIQLQIINDSGWVSNIQTKYKDLVKSLNIYMSTISDVTVTIDGTDSNAYAESTKPSVGDSTYYLLHSIPIDELATGLTQIPYADTDTTVQTLQKTLGIDNLTQHSLGANSLFSYNSRMFMGDITNYLFAGFTADMLTKPHTGYTTSTNYEIGIEWKLKIATGEVIVFSGWKTKNWYNSGTTQIEFDWMNDIIGYPDRRAVSARILVRTGGSTIYEVEEVPLTSADVGNFAYALEEGGKTYTGGAWGVTTLNTETTTYRDYNRVQASELLNPFYWPAINSYRIGNGTVMGLISNAIALSSGQFGQFPIFCLTSEGIWAMNLGDGEVLISTITPLNRHVCNNADSITAIDGGAVFSTSEGLILISGNETLEISESAEGDYKSPLDDSINYQEIIDNPNICQVSDQICTVSFKDYLIGAIIGYDYINRELIVSNNTYDYSWVYSLKHSTWFKISDVYSSFIPDYPNTLGYHTESTIHYVTNISQESESDQVAIYLESRPLKISPAQYKKIARMLAHGSINFSDGKPVLISLFGSIDSVNWHLLNASRLINNNNGMLIGRSTFSAKYYCLVIAGNVLPGTLLTHLTVDYEERYAGKLR